MALLVSLVGATLLVMKHASFTPSPQNALASTVQEQSNPSTGWAHATAAPQDEAGEAKRAAPPTKEVETFITSRRHLEGETKFPQFRWEGGGVTGPTKSEVEAYLDELFERFFHNPSAATCATVMDIHSGEEGNARGTPVLMKTLFDLVANLTVQSRMEDDCWIHLTPHQRAMCLLVASMDERSDTYDKSRFPPFNFSFYISDPPAKREDGFIPLRHRRSYLESYCSTMNPCLQWQSGKFSMPINVSFLETVYREEVIPLVTKDEENRKAAELFTKNFIHDHENTEEFRWAWERHSVQELDMGKHAATFDRLRREVRARELNEEFHPKADDEKVMEWAKSYHDVFPVFQGNRLLYDFDRRQARVVAPDSGEEVALAHFTPLQVLSLLHHKAFTSHSRRKRYTHPDDILSEDPVWKPNTHIIVFSGDSMNREYYMRLVHHVRHGLLHPEGNPWLRQTPFHEPSQQHDMILSVFETHDRLELFNSQMSDPRSTRTVQSYFQKLKWDLRKWERAFRTANSSTEKVELLAKRPAVALFYLVYYWDPQTDVYRQDAFVSQLMLKNVIGNLERDLIDSSIFSRLTPHELHIGSAAQQRKAKRVEKSISPPTKNPCEVRVRMLDGKTKIVNLANFDGLPELGIKGRAKGGLQGPALTLGQCTPERRLAAEKLRSQVLQRYQDTIFPRPVTPLREFGMKIAVHVQGNVFWELERNIEMMQHMMAMLAMTDDEVPLDIQSYPRRTIPKDGTELYMFTASFQEDLQPFHRWASPNFPERNLHLQRRTFSKVVDRRKVGMLLSSFNNRSSEGGNMGDVLGDEDIPFEEAVAQLGGEDGNASTEEEIALTSNESDASVVTATPVINSEGKGETATILTRLRHGLPLRDLALPKESHFNLIKNLRHFGWFERLLQVRKLRAAGNGAQADETKAHALRRQQSVNNESPFRFASYVGLLDMGKIQQMRFSQGDNRHFSCRYIQVKDRNRFTSTFEHFTIRHILSLGSDVANMEHVLCHNESRRWPRVEGNETKDGVPLRLEDMVRLFVRMFHPTEIRSGLWHSSGMEEAEKRESAKHWIMHLDDKKEYGVIFHDDQDRCVDEGNLFLLDVLLSHMVMRDAPLTHP